MFNIVDHIGGNLNKKQKHIRNNIYERFRSIVPLFFIIIIGAVLSNVET